MIGLPFGDGWKTDQITASQINWSMAMALFKHLFWSWRPTWGVVIHVGLWALENPVSMVCSVFCQCFLVLLLRCGWLIPSASQMVQLEVLRHSFAMGQTLCDWLYSGFSPERICGTAPLACCTATSSLISGCILHGWKNAFIHAIVS